MESVSAIAQSPLKADFLTKEQEAERKKNNAKPSELNNPANNSTGDIVSLSQKSIDQIKQNGFDSAHAGKVQKTQFGADGVTVATETLGASTQQGTAVSVTRTPSKNDTGEVSNSYSLSLTNKNGVNLDLNFMGNVSITEEDDGATSIYFSATNKTQRYDATGAMTETEGNALNQNANSVIINVSGSEVSTGAGDDIILNFADNAIITTGDGNDTVYLSELSQGTTINAGAGDDTVYLNGRNQTANLGEGNNTVYANGMNGSQITADNGDNIVNISGSVWANSQISMGNGNNVVQAAEMHDATVGLGGGNNKMKVDAMGANSSATLGNGNNQVDVYSVEKNAFLELGDGNNALNIYQVREQAGVALGSGNNAIKLNRVEDSAKVKLGDGDNDIRINEMTGDARLEAGNGNNIGSIGSLDGRAFAGFGAGDNFITYRKSADTNIILGGGVAHDLDKKMASDERQRISDSLESLRNDRAEKELPTTTADTRFDGSAGQGIPLRPTRMPRVDQFV